MAKSKVQKKEHVHMVGPMTFAALWTLCDRGMQAGSGGWRKDVNCWGRTGIVKTKGWKLISTDQSLVTCPACLREMKPLKGGKRAIRSGSMMALNVG